jgi:Fe-S-cluster-containing dehydrogenase component
MSSLNSPGHEAMRRLALQRRDFLKLLSASVALAGASSCSGPPPQQIVPWVRKPEGMTPSIPQMYATSLRCASDVIGVLVETHEGRPTKIEGNPLHPASLGATDVWAQAAVLELWDPTRSQAVLQRGSIASWDDFLATAADSRRESLESGHGLHVLSGRVDSPTVAAQRRRLLSRYPGSKWYEFEAVDDDNTLQGAQLAFGKPLRPRYRLDRAEVIVALEADFLGSIAGHVRYARDFADKRKPESSEATVSGNRLYVLEPSPSLTGMRADHRWAFSSGDIEQFATLLAVSIIDATAPSAQHPWSRIIAALSADLQAHAGRSLVLAGPYQPAHVHALAHLINQKLGNAGETVEYFELPAAETGSAQIGSIRSLVENMNAGSVTTLVIIDGNPVYAAPADLHFEAALAKVTRCIHFGLYADETAQQSTWHIPAAHALESWSDTRDFDGAASIVQPVIAPLYGGRSVHQLLSVFLPEENEADDLALIRSTWPELSEQQAWEHALRRGVIEETTPAVQPAQALPMTHPLLRSVDSSDSLELLFRPDPTIWDGRYANNSWLQELPKPVTQLTWSNAIQLSPALAAKWKLRNGDGVAVRLGANAVEGPIYIVPGQAASSVILSLGYGRSQSGQLCDGLGFNASKLRTSGDLRWRAAGASIQPTGRHTPLAATGEHHALTDAGREAVSAKMKLRSLYAERPKGEYRWGMTIDLNACIGCSACTIACQAENNIPVVGAEQVAWGREMHWIRVDPHFEGPVESPQISHQPVPCMHCDHAPCEVVCPVEATVHDSEGLNLQVYNRCVGTRFCSNNCPYKVRRFNFLQYSDAQTESLKGQRNPEVTVRNRGVMEKCTYCIQRIEAAHIASDREGRRIADGEIVTACQAVCPTKAITFGDTSTASSAVSREKRSPRNYALLEELNTRPQTTYLQDVRNLNPALKDEET